MYTSNLECTCQDVNVIHVEDSRSNFYLSFNLQLAILELQAELASADVGPSNMSINFDNDIFEVKGGHVYGPNTLIPNFLPVLFNFR